MMASAGNLKAVELGFLEKPDPTTGLTSAHFPSKVGGKPAWLELKQLPPPEQLACNVCKKPMVLLIQLYAPMRKRLYSFHRTVFVFMCRDRLCHQRGGRQAFKVFRSQLPQKNEFYAFSASSDSDSDLESSLPDSMSSPSRSQTGGSIRKRGSNEDLLKEFREKLEKEETSPSSPYHGEPSSVKKATMSVSDDDDSCGFLSSSLDDKLFDSLSSHMLPQQQQQQQQAAGGDQRLPTLCTVCGARGPKRCGKCRKVPYCSQEHQRHDWRSGHQLFCTDIAAGKLSEADVDYTPSKGVVLQEFEVVTEEEPETAASPAEKTDDEKMEDFYRFTRSSSLRKTEKKAVEVAKSEHTTDKHFRAFKKRIAVEPEQVVRYQRAGDPLLVSEEGIPSVSDIPSCECGAARVFEFQIMPQLLYFLKLDTVSSPSIDWGTLLIYTCSNSCSTKSGYEEEFLWKQDFSDFSRKQIK